MAENETLADFTVVWGVGERRVEKPGLEGFRVRAVEREGVLLRGLVVGNSGGGKG